MDDIDFASECMDAFNDAAIQAVRVRPALSPSTGICQSCEEPIEPERIEANPSARLCCDCAAEAEAERKRNRRCGPG
ncbi:MAG: TraR/DksA C4-type zinc finger protein [Rhodospirillaceae bacterium]|nr:TraR/DksA C4-type zinc finger protein [Rhodospirillaceae bacterium]